MYLAPLNALWAEYALENLGYSSTQAAQLIAPLTNQSAILSMNQYFQNNPIQNTVAYAALRNQGYSPSFAANWVASEEGEPLWSQALNDILMPAENAQQSFTEWFILGIIGAIVFSLLLILIL